MKEIWKDIVGYEKMYQVSNYGRIRSITRIVKDKNGRVMKYKGKMLKPSTDQKKKYQRVILMSNGHSSTELVHRLVANAFIKNPLNLPCINHKDEDPTNNNVNNLEWCTWEYNDNYGNHRKRISDGHSKEVAQYTIDGTKIKTYKNAFEAEKETGIGASQIRAVAIGKIRHNKHGRQPFWTAGGYKWKYIEKGK